MSLRTQCGCAEGFCLQNGVLLRSINQRPRTPQPLGFSREGREQPWTYHQRPGQEVLCLLSRLCLWESLSLGATFSQTNLFLFRRGNGGQRGACWAQVHRTSHHCAASFLLYQHQSCQPGMVSPRRKTLNRELRFSPTCVTLDKSLPLSGPWFLHVKCEDFSSS